MTDPRAGQRRTPEQIQRMLEAHDRYQAAQRRSLPGHVTLKEASQIVHRTVQTLAERIRLGTLQAVKAREGRTTEYWIALEELDRAYPRSKRTKYTTLTTEQQRATLGADVLIASDPTDRATIIATITEQNP